MEQTLTNQNASRILVHEKFDGKGFTTNNSLAAMRLTKADTLNPVITHLMGNENKKFPLTFLTEGQKGGLKKNSIQDVEYNWPVMSRMKKSDTIVSHEYGVDDTPGIGGAGHTDHTTGSQAGLFVVPDGLTQFLQIDTE